MRNILTIVIVSFLLASPVFAEEIVVTNNSSVVNTVSTSADTGGNSAKHGETIIQGEAKGSVHIETTVNGKTVEFVDETYTGSSTVHKEVSHEEEGVTTHTTVDIRTEGSTSSVRGGQGTNKNSLETIMAHTVETITSGNATSSGEGSSLGSVERTLKQSRLHTLLNYIKLYVFSFFSWK